MPHSIAIRRPRLLGVLLFLLAGGGACREPVTATHSLLVAHARWQATAPATYDFVFRRTCYCTDDAVRPVLIHVESGHVASVRYVDTGVAVADGARASYPTIDSLFGTIARAANLPADSIEAEYDPAFGFPMWAFIDYSVRTADDESGFAVSAFHAY